MPSTRQQNLAGFDESEEAPAAADDARSGTQQTATQQTAAPQTGKPQAAADADISGRTVYVVDAHSLIFQVYHALPEMSSPQGQPVGAVYGFTRDILYLIEEKQPDFLLCAFDPPGDTFRHEVYPEYKIDREAMPHDLRPQIDNIRRLLNALCIPVVIYENHEADDVLATIARDVEHRSGECLLVTGDKDCRQLITDRVKVYNIRKDEVFDAGALEKDWGIRPDQVVDFQALVGDSVDNVPGIPGIGKKTARDLLTEYGDLETVLDRAEEIKAKKRRESLIAGREEVLVSRRLVKLVDDLPLEVDYAAARIGGMDSDEVLRLFREFGFRSFVEKFTQLDGRDAPAAIETAYETIDTPEKLDRLIERLRDVRLLAIDTETTHLHPRWAELVGVSIAWEPSRAAYIPIRGPAGSALLDESLVLDKLAPLLTDRSIAKAGQNLKYDMIVLRAAGEGLAGAEFDTMIADYLLEAGARNHNLNELSRRYLNHTPVKIEELIGKGKNQKRMDEVPVDQIAHYAAEDADLPLRLERILRRRLEDEGLAHLMAELEMPLVPVLAEMEYNGIRLDLERLRELSDEYGRKLDRLETDIYQLAGRELNIASPKQLAAVLFDELQLPIVKKTKTGPSTDAEVLETLAKLHDLPQKIIEFRQYAKLKNTYVDALPELVHPETGRVHTSLNQVVAATGRLSSNEPNLQNIPIRTQEGREIRSAFVAGEPGWQLLAADYSQIELRVLAHFSQDEALLEAFAADEDIHRRVAAEVYGVAADDVTAEMRRSAKAINFGIIYGQSAFGLAKALDIEKDEAAEFIDAYFAKYPGVVAFLDTVLTEAATEGRVKTIRGRRRAITGVRDPAKQSAAERAKTSRQRNLPERTAINTVIQGSAADLIKQAMLNVHRRMQQEETRARLLLQIHDELLLESPPEEVDAIVGLVREEMTSAGELRVPLRVDVKVGKNWAECEPV